MLQVPPALPSTDLPPPGPVFQFFSLLLVVGLLVVLILYALPKQWRDKAFEFIFDATTLKGLR
jgi:hypothetical protein